MEHPEPKCFAKGTTYCIIWDFETKGIAKILQNKDCSTAITSVCWSNMAVAYLCLLLTSECVRIFSSSPIYRRVIVVILYLSIGNTSIHTILYFLYTLNFYMNTGTTTVLPVSLPETVTVRNKLSDGSACCTPTSACFNNYGDLVYVGNSKGEILVIDHKMLRVRGGEGQYVLMNSNDQTIRIYENLLPLKDVFRALDELSNIPDELDEVEKLKAVGATCLVLFRELQDSITKMHWKAPCFSGDGEWVVGGFANKLEHKIHIWDRAGRLVKILEAPKEALIDLAWHPVHSIVVSVSLTGLVYIWAKDYIENWSAFAMDFKELVENEEYVKESDVDEDNEVDIMTVEKDSAFSDSDMSQEEICFLAANLCHDVHVQQDKCIESSSKLVDSSHSGSPLYVEAGRNGIHRTSIKSNQSIQLQQG
ncbi:Protein RBL [Camellia lanceoleosa]|uniref:Protein RBL n=1 Tax=Camellia lanceoleosa TaxID=1840588 RepID=A0ACC0IMF9_9ERIC|nr:Protein RBL [Camellia lanceoleosa]